jgi:putative heme-binding domain-containing protein
VKNWRERVNTKATLAKWLVVNCCALLSVIHAAVLEADYNQWKQALGTNAATAVEHITTAPNFRVELIRSAQSSEGSWVAMTFDPKGRLVIAREDRGLLRFTFEPNRDAVVRVEMINTNLLECRGLLFAYGALYANANNSKALVRLRDTDGDDQFDDIKVLRQTPGGVGHGRNQLALGPDGFIYSIHGDDVGLPTNGISANSPLRHCAEDRLLPCAWDKHLFNAYARMPYGHLARTDRDGNTWEVIAGGLRNPFGIDFNQAGDLFTFDADMEWDVGLSWYHPTRVIHLVPGGDYGWRRGTGVLPVWSPDTLPSAVDIGLSSPTAIKFGTKSNWPEPWRSALFIEDWAYGKIYAVHLRKSGASYSGNSEVFLKGRPLNVTGLDFGPDGAMYFVTGGRRTQSGLYRVTWTGPSAQMAKASAQKVIPDARDIWGRLDDSDHWIRYAARVELEAKPGGEWQQRALTEARTMAALSALLALSRAGDKSLQAQVLERLNTFARSQLTAEQQIIAIRAVAVCCIRMGRPNDILTPQLLKSFEPRFPSEDSRVSQSLCELLVYLNSSNVVGRTIPLLASASTQEEKFHYLFTLRSVTNGWTIETRRTYFHWLRRARAEFVGANMLPTALNYIRADAEATLSATERSELRDMLKALEQPTMSAPPPDTARKFVKEWTLSDFGELRSLGEKRDLARGKRLFAEAGCAQCHRVGSEGGFIGPDLTAVSARFDRRALLESIIEPSRVIAESYRTVSIALKTGAIHDGRIASEDANAIMLAINPVDPDQRRRILKSEIASQRVSEISPMPAGLLNTLTQDEVLDLLAWLESPAGAQPDWVGPMKVVHGRFHGAKGTLAQFGDSITVTLAYWAPLADKPKNMDADTARAHSAVNTYLKPECWRGWKGARFGNEGRMTIRWAHANVDAWLKALNPEVAVIMFGSNDVGEMDVAEYETKTREVVQRCLRNGTVVVLTTPPPRHGRLAKCREFADAVRKVAREEHLPLVDYSAEILQRRPEDWDGALPQFQGTPGDEYQVPTLIARDGVHPSNPSKWHNDFSPEGLRHNGYTLRNYLTLRAYAGVIENILSGAE